MDWHEPLSRLRASLGERLSRASTVVRVGSRLGFVGATTFRGVRLLAQELARGRLNPSLIFRYYAENAPDRIALVEATRPGDAALRAPGAARSLTYRQTNDAIDRLGLGLLRRGVGPRASALVLVKNRLEMLLLQAGLGRVGASAVPASWRSTAPEIEYLALHAGARALFFDVDLVDLVREALPRFRSISRANFISVGGTVDGFVSLDELIGAERGVAPDRSEDGAVVMYTSGTTGKPKGAVRTFDNGVVAAALGIVGETEMRLGETHLAVSPLYHGTAFAFANLALLLGGSVVVMSDFRPELALEAVERYRVNSTALVPTMIHRIVELGAPAIRARDLSSLSGIFACGAPLGAALAAEAATLLGHKLYNFYGATETGLVTVAKPADLRAAPGTIGRPLPGNDVRLLDDAGRIVRDGEVGELFVRGGMLVRGYHDDQSATNASMREGYFSVGDLARRDARGLLHLEGRKRDLVISGGVNVYPAEVEGALEAHPAVAEAAVVGVTDAAWGERVRAFVVLRAGLHASEDDLKAHCRARLAGPKVPRDFVFLDRLPRNPTGKVLKRELRDLGES